MHRVGEALRVLEIGLRRLPPDQVGILGIGDAARDRIVLADAGLDAEEAFRRALARQELAVARIDVRGQELRRIGIGAREQDGRHTLDVGGEARRVERADMLLDRHQHLAAEMPAFLFRRELVLEMHARGARLDHRLHQLEGVQGAAETCFGVGDDRREPVGILPFFEEGPSMVWIWSARLSALLMRRTTSGTELTG